MDATGWTRQVTLSISAFPFPTIIFCPSLDLGASQLALVVKNPHANAGDIRDRGSIPGSGRSPGGGHGNPHQCFCLENPVDRGGWWATVHRVVKSWTRLG